MKKVYLAALITSLFITSACEPVSNKTDKDKKYHLSQKKIYHFSDGRVGYHTDTSPLIWYWLIMSNTSSSISNTPTIVGGWTKGPAPSPKDEEEASVEEQNVIETNDGEPVSSTEAEAIEATDPNITEATAGTEVTTEESSQTEATPTEDVTPSETTSSSDTGSSDTGGGDAGGGSSE